MAQARSSQHTAKLVALLAPHDLVALIGPAMSEKALADPDLDVDAAMDHWIPSGASPEMLRQAQRCLWKYIAWLYEEAVPRRPSWAPDEINRAVRRLVELQVAVRKVRPTFPIDAVALSPVFVARRRSVSVRHKRKCQGATE